MKKMITNLSNIAREAGAAIMEVRSKGFDVLNKDDKSPVTAADIASNKVIAKHLAELYPEIPVLSEEGTKIPYEERKLWKDFFLVDPLDGTKEFIKDNGEFCVCIALMRENRPVLGVVYAPTQDTLYTGSIETGAQVSRKGEKPVSISTTPPAEGEGLNIVGSRSHPAPALAEYLETLNVKEMTPAGSAIKFCLVAEGKAHQYPRFNPTMEWDTAAGQAIVEAAGGSMLGLDGKEFPYNKENLRNAGFIVKA
ncbi:3'(2'),5'-bisphosphate nucleotidase CysQ [Desulfovibrio sp. JC010]|uniref:3'(2'),5'-bisphosphate nucleotidase CysQ n=1 Tax=Desulfovibrio sp. JC010 TaxID=2593641 RepID=UPI0013D84C76|nr:3'(2'),5'-bisphosphate nucleotidase CysQ [Desulfovibrio sp. JC010]NDV28243.1 3'(2'),5'-bisphosphate nucleotidase CysQ [Desulfovibrio sp. JC010]